MHNYTTDEIHAFAILLFFFFYFLWKSKQFFTAFGDKSLLKRNWSMKRLKKLSWEDFELLCMALFAQKGWKVKGNEKKGADGGVDIWMQKRSLGKRTSAIVQCKRYDDALVTIKVIREMYGLMHEHNVDVAYIVTSNRFTKECYKFIEEKNIVLIDGEKLLQLIN
ncbi:MAG TPA: restriction endonuclease [Sulfurovum sp.]|nr:restriction endonuclease [Sulfurovum sp.]